MDEFALLQQTSVAHYQAAQELVAYHFFTDIRNPLRRSCSDPSVTLEYIPFLPLAWKVGFPSRTSCTSGGVCPVDPLMNPHCHISHLVTDILAYVQHAKSNSITTRHHIHTQTQTHALLPFVVSGALNVKTVLAHGMPTQSRRGQAWTDVMWFVGECIRLLHNVQS